MNTFIRKVNRHLLERYPTIWNTRLLWMALTALIIHIIYLAWGYGSFADIQPLHTERYGEFIVFEGVPFFISIVLAIVLLVVWLMSLLKNNALKSFYLQTKSKIFSSFIQYIIIFFLSISFPVSYIIGYKLFLNTAFDKKELQEDYIHMVKSQVFFLDHTSSYFISQRVFPAPYDTLFGISSNEIDERYP